MRDINRRVVVVGAVVAAIWLGVYAARWAYTEYWIATHCTMVLGTRVCQ